MANSYVSIALLDSNTEVNGVGQRIFGPVTFDYINDADVRFAILYNEEWTPISVTSVDSVTKRIELVDTPYNLFGIDASSSARIYRATTLNPVVDFKSGSRISEADLDNAYRQGLFAAQEVAEDAPGSVTRSVQTTDDIEDDSITTPKIVSAAVTTVKLADNSVTSGKLDTTLDLSGNTVTLPNSAITQAQVTQHIAAIKSGIDISSGMTGHLPVVSGGTGITTSTGLVLEQFFSPCDGVQVNLREGRTITPVSVTSLQNLTQTYVEASGSSLTYTPPTATQLVIYEYRSFVGAYDNSIPAMGFRLFIDSDEVTDCESIHFSGTGGEDIGWVTIKWCFAIGGTPNAATGRLASWTSDKTIRVKAKHRDNSSYEAVLHARRNTINPADTVSGMTASVPGTFIRPSVGITAIG